MLTTSRHEHQTPHNCQNHVIIINSIEEKQGKNKQTALSYSLQWSHSLYLGKPLLSALAGWVAQNDTVFHLNNETDCVSCCKLSQRSVVLFCFFFVFFKWIRTLKALQLHNALNLIPWQNIKPSSLYVLSGALVTDTLTLFFLLLDISW